MTDEIEIHEVDSVTVAKTSEDKRGALRKRSRWLRSRKNVSHRAINDLAHQIGSLLKGKPEQRALRKVSSQTRGGLPKSARNK